MAQQFAMDFFRGLATVIGPVLGIILILALGYLAWIVFKKVRKGKEHGHGDGHDDHGHGSHDDHGGTVRQVLGPTLAVFAVIGVWSVLYLFGKSIETQADAVYPAVSPPAAAAPAPPAPLPCAASAEEAVRRTVSPGEFSPWFERLESPATHAMGFYVSDGASYEVCTEDRCFAVGETIDRKDWRVRNTGSTAFAMSCWLETLPASDD